MDVSVKKINKDEINDITINKAQKILNENNIPLKSLPGYGNSGIKKKRYAYSYR